MVLALAEDNLALQTYAIGFWKPLPTQTKSYEPLFFHIQVVYMSSSFWLLDHVIYLIPRKK